jgi:NAD(P)-dependent dehydrogenase (short-subunit alcohol dehydrogenase family)
MNLEITDKVAFVTGAAKGIGEATARSFVREGARVVLLDRDEAAGNALAAELGAAALFVSCDVSSGAQVAAAVARGAAHWGRLDFLVNNAGIQTYGTVTETDEVVWDRTMNVNLKGAFLCAHHALPHIVRAGGGVVVNVASVQAFMSQANVAAYVTSKTAMLGLTRSIAVDYAPTVRCVAVCPGSVDTPLWRSGVQQSPDPAVVRAECEAMHLAGRIAKPAEIADFIVFLCSGRAQFSTGQAYRVDGGLGVEIPGSKRN